MPQCILYTVIFPSERLVKYLDGIFTWSEGKYLVFPLSSSVLAVVCANQCKMDLNTAGKDILRHPVCLQLNCSRTINNGLSGGNDCRDRARWWWRVTLRGLYSWNQLLSLLLAPCRQCPESSICSPSWCCCYNTCHISCCVSPVGVSEVRRPDMFRHCAGHHLQFLESVIYLKFSGASTDVPK